MAMLNNQMYLNIGYNKKTHKNPSFDPMNIMMFPTRSLLKTNNLFRIF